MLKKAQILAAESLDGDLWSYSLTKYKDTSNYPDPGPMPGLRMMALGGSTPASGQGPAGSQDEGPGVAAWLWLPRPTALSAFSLPLKVMGRIKFTSKWANEFSRPLFTEPKIDTSGCGEGLASSNPSQSDSLSTLGQVTPVLCPRVLLM